MGYFLRLVFGLDQTGELFLKSQSCWPGRGEGSDLQHPVESRCRRDVLPQKSEPLGGWLRFPQMTRREHCLRRCGHVREGGNGAAGDTSEPP